MATTRTDARRATATGLVVALGVAALGVMAVLAQQPTASDDLRADAVRPILLVSGRDDHGLVERETVELLAEPALEGEGRVLAEVADGTLVRVLGDDGGTWFEVVTLDGSAAGWIDDHRLRGTAHVVAEEPACPSALHADVDGPVLASLRPSEQVELVDDHTTADGDVWLGVRTIQTDQLGMVRADRLAQLPGPAPVPGTPCAEVVPDPEAVPHRH